MITVQIFGLRKSRDTRAAERFFKERRVPVHFVDLDRKPMAPAEIQRFVDRFELPSLLDMAGKDYLDSGLKYTRVAGAELLDRIARRPGLLRLPLVRSGRRLSIGRDEESWKAMLSPD